MRHRRPAGVGGTVEQPAVPARGRADHRGRVGNLLDRLFREPGWLRGAVVDFIDLQWWPIFNVADICVTVGGALLLFTSLQGSPRQTDPAGDSSPQSADDRVDLP